MVQGLNQTVLYAGLNFHVQTEHLRSNGQQQIVSQLFFGGSVVSTRRTVYSHDFDHGQQNQIKQAVKQQHQDLVRDLIAGGFDDRIAGTPKSDELATISEDDEPTRPWASPTAGEAAMQFREGVLLLTKVLKHWEDAAKLDDQRPAYRAACQLMTKLVKSVAVTAALSSESTSEARLPGDTGGTPTISTLKAVSASNQGTVRTRDQTATSSPQNSGKSFAGGTATASAQDRTDGRGHSPSSEHASNTEPEVPRIEHVPLGVPDSPGDAGSASAVATFSDDHYRAAECFEMGMEAMHAHDHARALGLLTEAAALDPTNPRYGAALTKVKRLAASSG